MSSIFNKTDTTGKFLTTNLLDEGWEKLYQKPTFARAVLLALCYPMGMAAYLLSLPLRILGIFKEAVFLLKSFFQYCSNKFNDKSCDDFKADAFIFGMAFVECLSGIVGIACPPLAYKIDRLIYSYDIIRNASFLNPQWETIGQPFFQHMGQLVREAGTPR